jgi:hypothetical protein
MTTKATIDGFLGSGALAVVGVSRSGTKFGNAVFQDLRDKGWTVYPVNPHADEIHGARCYHSVEELPEDVEGVVVVVPPDQSEAVVRQAAASGIRRVWLQQGAESEATLAACDELGLEAVSKECILMYAEPVGSLHRFHRFFKRVFGRMPA